MQPKVLSSAPVVATQAACPSTCIDHQWVKSIDQIDEQIWDQCFGRENVKQSYALQKATERTGLADVTFHYLLVKQAEVTNAIFPCFEFKISLINVASLWINKLVSAMRRVFPHFLYLRMFIIGTPVSICQDLFGIRPDIDLSTANHILAAACDVAIARAEELGIGLVIVKEITSRLLPQVRVVLQSRFTLAESPATTYLYVGESGAGSYRARLRTKYRTVMSARLRNFSDAGLRWETHTDFAKYAKSMHALYLQVLLRSKVRFEELTPEFFVQVSEQLGENAFAQLCFDGDRLVACALVLQDKLRTHPMYLGMDDAYRDKASLYYNCIYKVIDVVERSEQPIVQLGQTSYTAKAAIGAVVDRLYVGVRHRNRLLNLIISRFRDELFPPTIIPRQQRVFRDVDSNNQALRRYHVAFEEIPGDNRVD